MDVVGRATSGLHMVHCVAAVERGSAAVGSSSHFRAAASTSSSSADCCTLRSHLGLAGSSLPRRRRRSSSSRRTNFSFISSSFRSSPKTRRSFSSNATTLTPVSSLQEENLFSRIDADGLEVEIAGLLAQSSDMDWRLLVDQLHSEALQSVESLGAKTLSLNTLEEEVRSWIHDRMVQDIEAPIEGGVSLEDDLGWSYESAADELRMQANLQAAQHLARSVEDSFDWEAEAMELHRRVFRYGGAETPEAMNPEQRLLHAWFQAQGEELDSSTRQVQEALASTAAIEARDWQFFDRGGVKENEVLSKPQLEAVSSGGGGGASESDSFILDKSWFGLGVALAAGIGVHGASAMEAIVSDPSSRLQPSPESMEAASRAPSWLTPAILSFPVVSYFAFNFYRDKVNPYAKVTDWMFSVVALVIVANIVLMATIGVRLY